MPEGDAADHQVFQEGMVPAQEHSHDPQEHVYNNVVANPDANRVQMTSQGAEQTEWGGYYNMLHIQALTLYGDVCPS